MDIGALSMAMSMYNANSAAGIALEKMAINNMNTEGQAMTSMIAQSGQPAASINPLIGNNIDLIA